MNDFWQTVAVWAFIAIAGAIAVASGISAWRAIRRGECGSCAGCGGELPDTSGSRKKERIVFLPAENLRRRKRAR